MICPFCSNKTHIYNSRSTHQNTQTWRRHRCKSCNSTFTTKEKVDWTARVSVITSDETSHYSRERLLLSISRASKNLQLAPASLSELTDSVELALQKNHFFESETQEATVIVQAATTTLQRFDPNLALQYVNQIYNNKPPLELVKSLVSA